MHKIVLLACVLGLACAPMLRAEEAGGAPEKAAHDSEAAGDIEQAHALRLKMLAAADAKLKEMAQLMQNGAVSQREVRDAELEVEAQKTNVLRLERLLKQRPGKEDPIAVWRKKTEEQMDQPITMDFMNADLEWAANTLFVLTGVQLQLDPALQGRKVSLHVESMPLRSVLNWIARQGNLKWELRDYAVYLYAGGEAGANPKEAARFDAGSRLRVKLAGGEEVEADAELLNHYPGLAEALLDRALDPAKDGFLAYRVVKEGPGLTQDELAKRVAAFAPKAKLEPLEGNLVLVTTENPADLAGLAARLRLLGIFRAHGPAPAAETKAAALGAEPIVEVDKNLEGVVVAVKPEQHLVMVSLGSAQGAKAGMPVIFSRKDKLVATGVITRVYPDMSAVDMGSHAGDVQVHDTVRTASAAEHKKTEAGPKAP